MRPIRRHIYDRPIGVIAILVAILVLGALAIPEMRIRLITSGDFGSRIYTSFRVNGLGLLETLDRVTRPAEEIARSQPSTGRVETETSSGYVSMRVEPAAGYSNKELATQITQALESNKHRFPDDMSPPRIYSWSESSMPLMIVAINRGNLSEDEFDQLILQKLLPTIQAVPGIAKADTYMRSDPSVRIAFNTMRLGSIGMDPDKAVQALSSASGRSASTNAPLSIHDEKSDRYVRIVPPLLTPATLPAARINHNTSLSDIAAIEPHDPSRHEFRLLIDGKPGEGLIIYPSADANVYKLSKSIATLVEKECERHQLQHRIIQDSHTAFDEIANEILVSAAWCAAFSLLFLILFLGRWRMALLVSTALPLSLILALVAMAISGKNLDLLSLIGYLLAAGMVVDNAIVVAESLMRARTTDDPEERKIILKRAVNSVALAIVVATLTTVAMFLPALVVDQPMVRTMLSSIGYPIILSLVGSLVVALILVPMAFKWIYPHGLQSKKNIKSTSATTGDGRAQVRWLRWLERRYGRILAWVLLRPMLGLLIVLSIIGAGIYATVKLDSPRDNYYNEERSIAISARVSKSLTLDQIADQARVWSEQLEPLREELGIIGILANINRYYTSLEIYLKPIDEQNRSSDEIRDIIVLALTSTPDIVIREHNELAQFYATYIEKQKKNAEKLAKETASKSGITSDAEEQSSSKNTNTDESNKKSSTTTTQSNHDDKNKTADTAKENDAQEKPAFVPRLGFIELEISAAQPAAVEIAKKRLTAVLVAEGGAPTDEKERSKRRRRGRSSDADDGLISLRLTRAAEQQGWQADAVARQVARYTGGENSVEMPGGWRLGYGRAKTDDTSLNALLETVVYQSPTIPNRNTPARNTAPTAPTNAPSTTQKSPTANAQTGRTLTTNAPAVNNTPAVQPPISAPLLRLVEPSTEPPARYIRRENGLSTDSVSVNVLLSERQRILDNLPELITRADIPNGVAVKPKLFANNEDESKWALLLATLIAAVIVYLLMAILYESLLAPLTMMTTVPAAILSVKALYLVLQIPMSPMDYLGILLLVGIVINNGVVLVDRMVMTVPMHRIQGRSYQRMATIAMAAAARRRFTPVLLTSLTTIAAAVPMSFSDGRIFGQPIASLGVSLGIGLTAATVFTLAVVPIFYQWLAITRAGTLTLLSNKRS